MKKVLEIASILPLFILLALALSGLIIFKGIWYCDLDGDGCGDSDKVIESRIKPKGYVGNDNDPDDSNPDDCSPPTMPPFFPWG